MKNVLIIVANPKEDSLSFAIANKYKELNEKANNNVELLDLYRDENRQNFFTYTDDPYAIKETNEMKYYQKMITDADEIAIVFPYWWGSMPAILKNFFDWNLSSGYAFTYKDGKIQGLLKDKDVKVFVTTGAPKFYYILTGANRRLKNMFKEQIINFCGMNLKEFNIFGGIDSGFKGADKIFEKIKL
jgi:putative NADPH-quinone reductase